MRKYYISLAAVVVIFIALVSSLLIFSGPTYYRRVCIEYFYQNGQNTTIENPVIMNRIRTAADNLGLERTLLESIDYSTFITDPKFPFELTGVYCSARISLCKKEGSMISYCQKYEFPYYVDLVDKTVR